MVQGAGLEQQRKRWCHLSGWGKGERGQERGAGLAGGGKNSGFHTFGCHQHPMLLTYSPDHSAYVSCFDKAHLAIPDLLLLNTVSECTGSYIQFPCHWVPRGKIFKNKISCKGSRPESSSISHLHFLHRQGSPLHFTDFFSQ